MISDSYNLDTIEETFDVALEIDMTLTTLVNAKARCLRDMSTMIISAPRRVDMLVLYLMMLTRKLLRVFTILLRLLV